MAKERIPVPDDVKARIVYGSNRTCVVCNEPGRACQIHHINEDPSDNEEQNLALLCHDCHDKTQVRGGFGRHLDAATVRKCRDEWLKRVTEMRARVDHLLAERMAGTSDAGPTSPVGEFDLPVLPLSSLLPYVMSLPVAMEAAHRLAREQSEGGSMADIRRAIYEVIEVGEQMLVRLAAWRDPRHFGGVSSREFFSQHVSRRFLWRRGLAETAYGGTMTTDITLGAVLADVEDDVEQLVEALIGEDHSDVLKDWKGKWAAANREPEPEVAAPTQGEGDAEDHDDH